MGRVLGLNLEDKISLAICKWQGRIILALTNERILKQMELYSSKVSLRSSAETAAASQYYATAQAICHGGDHFGVAAVLFKSCDILKLHLSPCPRKNFQMVT